jgi:NCS1 family nucleobase:cation symporter-1
MVQFDEVDIYGTFTPKEAQRLGIAPVDEDSSLVGITAADVGDGVSYGSIEHVSVGREGLKL